MATVTPNFNWPVPTSTDLVKDGATAIEALGDSIDASLVDLKGGTTGQVLSKTTNTDMDFTWTSPNPGDITAVNAGTGITGGGTSGDVTVSFDQANFGGGQFAAGKNRIINGDFGINQRTFTSVATNGSYGFDRWQILENGGTTAYTPQTFTPGTAPVAGYESINFARVQISGQTTSSNRCLIQQRIENVRTFAGQTATFSFWAKVSSGTPNIAFELLQNFGSGGSPSTQVTTIGVTTFTLSTSWTRYSVTVNVPSISGKTLGTTANTSFLAVAFWLSGGSDFNARTNSLGLQAITLDLWGVQAEAGSVATPFQTATGTLQGELAACQRYYQTFGGTTSTPYQYLSLGRATTTTNGLMWFPTKQTMRGTPSPTFDSAANFALSGGTIVSFAADQIGPDFIQFNVTCTGLTAGDSLALYANNQTNNRQIQLNAEL